MALIKGHFNLAKYMEMGNLYGMMERYIKEIFNKGNCMAMEL